MTELLLKIIHPLRRFYWRIFRSETRGVRAIILTQEGKILLVEHKYENGWFLPGGRSHKNESDEAALARELKEELGISNLGQVTKLGIYANTYEYKKDTITVFIVRSFDQVLKSHFEIKQHQFFFPADLPESTSPGTKRRIQEYLGQKPVTQTW